MCLRSGTALPTYRCQVQLCTSLIFLLLSVGKSAHAIQNFLLSIPSLSLCSRCTIPHKMVGAKQCMYDNFILPAIKNNNIAVFMGKIWLQKKGLP